MIRLRIRKSLALACIGLVVFAAFLPAASGDSSKRFSARSGYTAQGMIVPRWKDAAAI